MVETRGLINRLFVVIFLFGQIGIVDLNAYAFCEPSNLIAICCVFLVHVPLPVANFILAQKNKGKRNFSKNSSLFRTIAIAHIRTYSICISSIPSLISQFRAKCQSKMILNIGKNPNVSKNEWQL